MIQKFIQQVKNSVQESMDGIHTCIPGKIVSFDAAKCTAVVKPIGKFKRPNGNSSDGASGGKVDYPQIAQVPVHFQQSSSQESCICFPVKPGDGCLLLFSEQALDAWRSGGEDFPDLKHDLTNAIAIMGVCRQPNTIMQEAQNKDAIIIRQKDSRAMFSNEEVLIKRNDDQLLQMKGSEILLKNGGTTLKLTPDGAELVGNLKVSGQITAQGDVIGAGISLQSHTHSGMESGSGNTGTPQ